MSLSSLLFREATSADRLPLFRMLELYQHDLSDIWDQDLDVHGEYGYALDRFWQEEDCHAFVALLNGYYAGFALVDRATKIAASGHWMDQFFVLSVLFIFLFIHVPLLSLYRQLRWCALV